MSLVIVGVGDCRVSNDPESMLVTYALGSCIAVMIHDSIAGVGGLLHFMLPESSLDRAKAEKNPICSPTVESRVFSKEFTNWARRNAGWWLPPPGEPK